jgi:hypothetical protein
MVDISRTELTQVPADETVTYTGTLLDGNGNPIPGSAITTLLFSLYDTMLNEIVNGLDQINVVISGKGSISSSGVITLNLAVEDMQPTGSPPPNTIQYRTIVFDWWYNGGVSKGRDHFDFQIVV